MKAFRYAIAPVGDCGEQMQGECLGLIRCLIGRCHCHLQTGQHDWQKCEACSFVIKVANDFAHSKPVAVKKNYELPTTDREGCFVKDKLSGSFNCFFLIVLGQGRIASLVAGRCPDTANESVGLESCFLCRSLRERIGSGKVRRSSSGAFRCDGYQDDAASHPAARHRP